MQTLCRAKKEQVKKSLVVDKIRRYSNFTCANLPSTSTGRGPPRMSSRFSSTTVSIDSFRFSLHVAAGESFAACRSDDEGAAEELAVAAAGAKAETAHNAHNAMTTRAPIVVGAGMILITVVVRGGGEEESRGHPNRGRERDREG